MEPYHIGLTNITPHPAGLYSEQNDLVLTQVTARFAAANAAGVSRLLFTSGTVLATGEPPLEPPLA